MKTCTLGRRKLPVSALGLGMAALGRPAYITPNRDTDLPEERSPEALEARSYAMLDAAWAAGIRYIDCARSYGRAEAFLGSWLRQRQIPLDALSVGSKWGYTYVGNWQQQASVHEMQDHSLAMLRRQSLESSALIGRHLKLYQIHSINRLGGVLGDGDVLTDMLRLREQGLSLGVTVSGPRQAAILERIALLQIGGEPLFDTVQVTWNLLEPSLAPFLNSLHNQGYGIIIKESLANGRLLGSIDASRQQRLTAEADRLGCTVDALAIAAALAQPWADVVLLGAVSEAQLASNLRALDLTLDKATLRRLQALAEPVADYWQQHSDLPWQ